MNANNITKKSPLISVGSFFIGVMTMVLGILWAHHEAGASAGQFGLAFWPLAVTSVVTIVINLVAFCSPNGSIIELCIEIFREFKK